MITQGKNSKLKSKTQGFGKVKNAVCRKRVQKKACCNPSKAAFLTDFSITLIKGQTTRTLNKVRSMKDSFKHDAMLKILMSNSFFRRSWGGFNQRCVRPDRRGRRDSETGDPVAKEPGSGPGVSEQEEGVHKVPGEPGSRP